MASAGVVAFILKYDWVSGSNYTIYNLVYYGGSTYVAKNNITGGTIAPDTDTTNWQLFAHGYIADNLSAIDATDTSGLIGTAGATVSSQTLIDKIADMVADKLVLKTAISNQQVNDTTKVPSSALTYTMNQSIIDLNSNLTNETWSTIQGTNNTQIDYNKRSGYVQVIVFAGGISVTAGNDYTIATLPVGYRPLKTIRVSNYRTGSYVLIYPTGNVILTCYDSSDAASLYVSCNLVFQAT